MTNEEYERLALQTAPQADSVPYNQSALCLAALGMAGETGEIVDIIKKVVFHRHELDEPTRQRLIKEMGDVEWYANCLRVYLNTTLEEVHAVNIAKLKARYPEGHFSSERSLHRAEGDS